MDEARLKDLRHPRKFLRVSWAPETSGPGADRGRSQAGPRRLLPAPRTRQPSAFVRGPVARRASSGAQSGAVQFP